jgi:hypothetical protein
MNTLVSAFLIQLLLCVIFFAHFFNLVVRNSKLKKDIESETAKLENDMRN